MMTDEEEAGSAPSGYTLEKKRRHSYAFEIASHASEKEVKNKEHLLDKEEKGLNWRPPTDTHNRIEVETDSAADESQHIDVRLAPRGRSYSDMTVGAREGALKSYSTFERADHSGIIYSLVEAHKRVKLNLAHLSFEASHLVRFRTDSYHIEGSARHLSSRSSMQKSSLHGLIEKTSSDRGASVLLAVWNILPLLQGSSIFSMPYAVAVGGYLTLPAIVFVSFLADVTGGILIDCLYETSSRSGERKRVRLDYVDIALSVWGNHGARIISAILILYLFSGASVNILLIGKSVHSVLGPHASLSFVTLTSIFSIACYPTLFIRRLTIIAYLSMLSLASVLLGIITVFCVFVMNYDKWPANASFISVVHGEGFLLALSIVLFSCMSHTVLPQIEGNMAEPLKFPRAIHTSYFISSILKALVGMLGFLTYGVLAQSLVTLNVSEFNLAARIVCSIALTGFGIFNYPLNLFVVGNTCDSFVENTRFGQNGRFYLIWFALTRLVLTVLSVVIALVLPYFGILLAVRGSLIGTCLIFIFPCYFQLRLKWKRLTKLQIARNITLMVVGIAIGSAGLFSSLDSLAKAIRGSEINS